MSSMRVSKELQNIISDNTSGSSELLYKLNNYIEKNRREINNELISLLQNSFPDFQTILDYLSKLKIALVNNKLDNFFSERKLNKEKMFNSIFHNLQKEIEHYNSFITISNSTTILEIFKLIYGLKKNLKVIISEGRPNCEGRILAQNLATENINTKLITEAQIFNSIKKCDCAVIGADRILANGNVINKVGSNLLALACKEYSKPFFVIADKTKLSDNSIFHKQEMPAVEIYNATNNEIEINNYYFEEIPNKFITKIITN